MITHQLAELDEQLAKVPTSSLSDTQKTAATAALNAKKQKLTDLQKQVAAAQSVADVQAVSRPRASATAGTRSSTTVRTAGPWTASTARRTRAGTAAVGLGLGLGQGLGNLGGFGGYDSGHGEATATDA